MKKKYFTAAVICMFLAVVCAVFAITSANRPPEHGYSDETSTSSETESDTDRMPHEDSETTAEYSDSHENIVETDTQSEVTAETESAETETETESESPESKEDTADTAVDSSYTPETEESVSQTEMETSAATETEAWRETQSETEKETEPPASETENAAPPYESPIDFDKLRADNPDVYAWIKIDGTNVDFAVCQHPTDDSFYLTIGYDRKPAKEGAIYTEATYNTTTFDDRVTVIYGHRMNSGAMFGELQPTYSEKENFDKLNKLVIYTPNEELNYKIVAALPYNNYHILANYDLDSPFWYYDFFDTMISTRAVGANFDSTYTPNYDDKMVILSTCLWGNQSKRYLILATLQG